MQIRLEYRDKPGLSPLTPWVHRAIDGPYWKATVFDPPLPKPVHGKGYPVWFVDHRGRSLVFASPEEIAHVVDKEFERRLRTVSVVVFGFVPGGVRGGFGHGVTRG